MYEPIEILCAHVYFGRYTFTLNQEVVKMEIKLANTLLTFTMNKEKQDLDPYSNALNNKHLVSYLPMIQTFSSTHS